MQRTINKSPQTAFFRNGRLGNNIVTPIDPFFSNVSVLLKMKGTIGSTTFTDSSLNNISFTASGTAALSNAVAAKFGGTVASFDASFDYIQCSTNAVFGFGTGDFTIEGWVYKTTAIANFNCIFDVGTNEILMRLQVASNSLVLDTTNSYSWYPNLVFPLNQWNHVALVRNSGIVTVYLNGISITSFTDSADLGATQILTIGATSNATTQGLNGYIDEFRITKGVARYSGTNFAVPTTPFPTR
jgi:hypothetical protein